ncbi:MAG TPA: hypothetical protein VHL60_01130 [Oxalicibacterium sp.]|jgi:hypothetical protein|nr:hypothetical protein [Oxalicibacterium sp.]
MSTENTPENTELETVAIAEIESFCRHFGRTLKGVGTTDAGLAVRLIQESDYLEKNGFKRVANMFSAVAFELDPSLKIKIEYMRRQA